MPQMVRRNVCGIPFKFEIDFLSGEKLIAPYAVGNMPHVLLCEAGDICSKLGRGAYKVYIYALPDKDDPLEPVALSMMEDMSNCLEKSGVKFRAMYRNHYIHEDEDGEADTKVKKKKVLDAVVFQMFQPT